MERAAGACSGSAQLLSVCVVRIVAPSALGLEIRSFLPGAALCRGMELTHWSCASTSSFREGHWSVPSTSFKFLSTSNTGSLGQLRAGGQLNNAVIMVARAVIAVPGASRLKSRCHSIVCPKDVVLQRQGWH